MEKRQYLSRCERIWIIRRNECEKERAHWDILYWLNQPLGECIHYWRLGARCLKSCNIIRIERAYSVITKLHYLRALPCFLTNNNKLYKFLRNPLLYLKWRNFDPILMRLHFILFFTRRLPTNQSKICSVHL